MSKLLFTHSYFYRFDPKQWANAMPYPPYGTIYAASYMRAHGYQVSLFDTCLVQDQKEIIPLIEAEKPEYLILYDDGFNYLTKMCLTRMREAAFDMAMIAKQYGCKVIVSSSDSTDHAELYLAHGADYVLIGEAELTLLELVEALNNGHSVANLLGIAYTLNGALQLNPKRPVIKELDLLGTPAWDLIDIPAYKQIWMDAHGYFGLNIATTRGCPYKCNWCAKPIYGNRYNSRSPQAVVSEIKMLVSKFGAEYLWVCDDIFGLKPGWVQAFRDELRKNDLVIKYKIQSRVDLLLEGDNIDALAESGLHEVWVGAESGSQKILDAMDKGTQVNEIYNATKLLQSKGIRVAFFLQFGYLGEEMDDIQKTVDMLLELMPDDIGVSVSYPLPGTKFYEKVKDDLMAKSNWVDSDDLDMMYKANYSRRFYKRLHRYIHKMYRGKQAILRAKQLAKKPNDFRRSDVYKLLSLGYYVPGAIIDKWRLNRLAQVVQ